MLLVSFYIHLFACRPGLLGPFIRSVGLLSVPPAASGLLAALLLSGLAPALQAQGSSAALGGWYAVDGRWEPTDQRWGVEMDLQLRGFEVADDFAQASVRGGIVFEPPALPGEWVVGAAWFVNGNEGPDETLLEELRLYQTVVLEQVLSRHLRLGHRLRAEQRWPDRDGFRTRYRYRVGLETPLARAGRDDEVFLILSDEILLNGETTLADGRPVGRLDENRSYLALNGPLRAGPMRTGARWEVGYLNINGDSQPLHRVRVTLQLRW